MGIRITQEVIEVLLVNNPNVRITQEVVEVLSTYNPNVRITQEVVEVLRSTTDSSYIPVDNPQSVNSTITVTSAASGRNNVVRLTVNSSIGVAEDEILAGDRSIFIDSPVALSSTQSLHTNPVRRLIVSAIGVVETIVPINTQPRTEIGSAITVTSTIAIFTGRITVASGITVTQTIAFANTNPRLVVDSPIVVTSLTSPRSTIVRLNVNSSILIPAFYGAVAKVNPTRETVRTYITLVDTIGGGNSNRQVSVDTPVQVIPTIGSNHVYLTVNSPIIVATAIGGGNSNRRITLNSTIVVTPTLGQRSTMIHLSVTSAIDINDGVDDHGPVEYDEVNSLVRVRSQQSTMIAPHIRLNSLVNVTQAIVVRTSPIRHTIANTIQVTPSMRISPVALAVNSSITVTDRLRLAEITVHHFVHISQAVNKDERLRFLDTLTFTQTVIATHVFNRIIIDSLPLVQSVGRNIIYNRQISQSLFLPDHTYDRFISLLAYPIPINVAVGSIDMAVVTLIGKYGYIILPTPEWGDSDGNVQSLNVIRTITGVTYTYVKSSDRRKLVYDFRIGLRKSFELRSFLILNQSEKIIIQDWKSNTFVAKCISNPFTLEAEGRWSQQNEVIHATIEFEGVKV